TAATLFMKAGSSAFPRKSMSARCGRSLRPTPAAPRPDAARPGKWRAASALWRREVSAIKAASFKIVEARLGHRGGERPTRQWHGDGLALKPAAAFDHRHGDRPADIGAVIAGGDMADHAHRWLGFQLRHHLSAFGNDLGRVSAQKPDQLLAVVARGIR